MPETDPVEVFLPPVCPPTGRAPLPLLGGPPAERSDAARNRVALLDAARRLVDADGVAALTMERLAAAAGVGKGTVFRRFGSREGLMAAVLDFTESAWQASVISGPAPLGPGAAPLERLLAFGASRAELTLVHADLIAAAGHRGSRNLAVHSFVETHVRYLLTQLGVRGDLPLVTSALIAPLEAPVLVQQVRIEGYPIDRVVAAWRDVAERIVRG
ncbi:TetR/AcrR family transcriptional regulator [Nocardioides fonticola]|uniref:TetR/AcrR family transcriptional regulator n=1 Tax=Nocardioides fonticola TaxID=450363 RepID=A0ABP7XBT8_9ACTN